MKINLPAISAKNRLSFLILLGILCFSAILYHQVSSHQFQTVWDDQWVAVNVYTEIGLTFENLQNILLKFYQGQYAPINQLYYTTLHSIFAYNPVAFHLAGLAIHIINTLLVYIFIKNLLLLSNFVLKKDAWKIAACTSFLFSIHPINVESVAWIAASKVLLYAGFYLGALITYQKYLQTNKTVFYVLTCVLFLFSFLSKEQAVTLPLTLILIDALRFKGRIPANIWVQKLPFFILMLFFGYITILSQASNGVGVITNSQQYPLFQRIVFGSYALLEYFFKCIIPVNLFYIYPFPMDVGETLPSRFYIYPFVLIIALLCFWKYLKIRWIAFGAGFFLINLLPVLHVIPLSRFAIIADRYVYVASISAFFIIAFVFNYALVRWRKYKNLIILLSVVYVSFLTTQTYSRNQVWHNSATLKKKLIEIIKGRPDYQKMLSKKSNLK